MGTAIQVSVHLPFEPNRESPASLAAEEHIERNGYAALHQVG